MANAKHTTAPATAIAPQQLLEDQIDALAADLWARIHPDEKWADQPFANVAQFFQSARLVLTP